MSIVLTKTPHQKITQAGISSQWEGKHIRFTDEKYDRLHICRCCRSALDDRDLKHDMDYRVDNSSIMTTYDFRSELNNILS